MLGWANCTGSWYNLPSGKSVCYISQPMLSQNRSNFCSHLGGYVFELHTLEDYKALVYYIWKLILYHGISQISLIAAAGVTLSKDTDNILIWENSGETVKDFLYDVIKPSETFPPQPNQFLYLQSMNFSNKFRPNFTLAGILYNDTESEFICMKSGTKQAKTLRKIISNALICILYCR
jgi:hypothetical protein